MSFCETRWVERHDRVMRFQELLHAIIAAFTTISMWPAKANGKLAAQVLRRVSSDVFAISLIILDKILAVTKGLTETLQMKDYNLVKCT